MPGLTTGDFSTTLLRRTLKARGFVPESWRIGINTGADAALLNILEARIEHLHGEPGKPVLLIGWSLGGLYARVLAQRVPERLEDKPPVPTNAIWSAVVGSGRHRCAKGDDGESDYRLRIDAPHFTIGTSRACIEKIIAKIAEVDAIEAG